MLKKHPLVAGTIILTVTGFISRIIGFFYRIYLSRLFGEEGMGIYQLLGPVLALSFSLTAAGIQTAISKYVAGETSTGNYRHSLRVLITGLTLSTMLSFLCMAVIIKFSEWIATAFLLEPRTASMLRIVALSLPLGAVHACINGYFYGIKKARVPAAAQLIEQFCRVGSVFIITTLTTKQGAVPTINVAVLGLVFGEGISMIFTIIAAYKRFTYLSINSAINILPANHICRHTQNPVEESSLQTILKNLLSLAIPLSLNRVVINFLQSIEAIYIPNKLLSYGYDTKTALSVYGVLTGMAMPLIMFPGALTNSVSVLLLPLVAEADATGNELLIKKAISKTIRYSTLLGVACMLIFLLSGKPVGNLIFNSPLAGHFIITLSFICPFLYLSSTLSSIINGLGKATAVFVINIISLLIRLAFVFFTIPFAGISGYLWGLLVSQIFTALAFIIYLGRKRKNY